MKCEVLLIFCSYSALFVSLAGNVPPYCTGMIRNLYPVAWGYGSDPIKCVGGVSLVSQQSQGKSEMISMLPAVVSSLVDALVSSRLATAWPQGPRKYSGRTFSVWALGNDCMAGG